MGTGAYLRVKRDGKWEAVEVENLSDEEREEILRDKRPDELIRWINLICKSIYHIPRLKNTKKYVDK